MRGVYRILKEIDGRGLVGSTTSLGSVKNRLEFAKSTNSPGAVDTKLKQPIQEHGLAAFTFEVLARLDPGDSAHRPFSADLRALEQLWRETIGPELLY